MRPVSLLVLAVCAALLPSEPVAAQARQMEQPPSRRLLVTRPELQRYLTQLQDAALAPKLGGMKPEFLRAETTFVKQRLEQGDFRVGDRLLISVEDPGPISGGVVGPKSPEQELSDTFTVGNKQELALPGVGAVSLRGVLRAELEPFLAVEIARYINDPVVHARPLINLGISGGALRAGYYTVPADAPLPVLLTTAGGAIKGAKLNEVVIRRGGLVVWDRDAVRNAIANGLTIDEMGLHPGDEVFVPEKTGATTYDHLKFIAVALSIPISLYTIGQIAK